MRAATSHPRAPLDVLPRPRVPLPPKKAAEDRRRGAAGPLRSMGQGPQPQAETAPRPDPPAARPRAASPAQISAGRTLARAAAPLEALSRRRELSNWWRQLAPPAAHEAVQVFVAAPFDRQIDALGALNHAASDLGAARTREIFRLVMGLAECSVVRRVAAGHLMDLRWRPPVDDDLEALFLNDQDPEVRQIYRRSRGGSLCSRHERWLEDPSGEVRREALLALAERSEHIGLLTRSLAQEERVDIVHDVLSQVARSHPRAAWGLWQTLPEAARARPTLSLLCRILGRPRVPQGRIPTHPAALEEGLVLFSEAPGLGRAWPGGGERILADRVVGLARLDTAAARALGRRLLAAGLNGDEGSVAATLDVARQLPDLALPVVRAHLVVARENSLVHLARALSQLAGRVEVYPIIRHLARHQAANVRESAALVLADFAEACPSCQLDALSVLEAQGVSTSSRVGLAAVGALDRLHLSLPRCAARTRGALRQVALRGHQAAQIAAVGALAALPSGAASDWPIAAAQISEFPPLRRAGRRAREQQMEAEWGQISLIEALARARSVLLSDDVHLVALSAHGVAAALAHDAMRTLAQAEAAMGALEAAADKARRAGDRESWQFPSQRAVPPLLRHFGRRRHVLLRLSAWASIWDDLAPTVVAGILACPGREKEQVVRALLANPKVADKVNEQVWRRLLGP